MVRSRPIHRGTIAPTNRRRPVGSSPGMIQRELTIHRGSEVDARGAAHPEHDVQMVGHDEERVNAPRTATHGTTELFQQPITIDVIAHDVLPAIASGHEMVDGARILES